MCSGTMRSTYFPSSLPEKIKKKGKESDGGAVGRECIIYFYFHLDCVQPCSLLLLLIQVCLIKKRLLEDKSLNDLAKTGKKSDTVSEAGYPNEWLDVAISSWKLSVIKGLRVSL